MKYILGKERQENQESQVLSYLVSLRLASAIQDPVSKITNNIK